MPDLTTALGRLLSDAGMRESFRSNPGEVADRFELSAADREALGAIDPEGLDAQADVLMRKRLHEARRYLPRTMEGLGDAAGGWFRRYAAGNWPVGHRRHVDDALGFAGFLADRRIPGRCRDEINRLRFLSRGGRFAVHVVPDLPIDGRPRSALQILYRDRGSQPRQLALFVDTGPWFSLLWRGRKRRRGGAG